MALVPKIDSDEIEVRIAEEQTLKTLPGSPVWEPHEPSGPPSIGATINRAEVDTFNTTRQRKKGPVVGLEAQCDFPEHLRQENLPGIGQGFFWSDLEVKNEVAISAAVDDTTDSFTVASGGDGYAAGDLIFVQGMDTPSNNGLHVVTGSPSSTDIPVTSTLTAESGQTGTGRRAGFEFTSGDLEVDASGDLPELQTTSKDLRDVFGGVEWIAIGGDEAGEQFAESANNGFFRVRTIGENAAVIDAGDSTMVTDEGTSKTIRVYVCPRILRDARDPANRVRRTYQVEQRLGAPDDSESSEIQYQYVTGTIANNLTINFPLEAAITMDLSFVPTDWETVDGPTAAKSGTRPSREDGEAYSTAVDILRTKVSVVKADDEAPTPLFAEIDELTLNIENGVQPLAAHGHKVAFEASKGKFAVSASMQVFFQTVAAFQSVLDNETVAFHRILGKANKGIFFDIPAATLQSEPPAAEMDGPIRVGLEVSAHEGVEVHEDITHTLAVGFFDHLPDRLMP